MFSIEHPAYGLNDRAESILIGYLSVCQEKYIVAHGLKGRHAVSVTQAIPCASVRGLSLTFNGHLSPTVQ